MDKEFPVISKLRKSEQTLLIGQTALRGGKDGKKALFPQSDSQSLLKSETQQF
jgi:hypothetical protein